MIFTKTTYAKNYFWKGKKRKAPIKAGLKLLPYPKYKTIPDRGGMLNVLKQIYVPLLLSKLYLSKI